MIAALIIYSFCCILMSKGVPTWLDVVLAIINAICVCVALIVWEETNTKIRTLENKISKMERESKNCTTCKHMVACEPNVFGMCDEYERCENNDR